MARTKQTARKSTACFAPKVQYATKREKTPMRPQVRQMARKSSALPPPCSPNVSRRTLKQRDDEPLEPRFTRLHLRKTAEQNRTEPPTSGGDTVDVNVKKLDRTNTPTR